MEFIVETLIDGSQYIYSYDENSNLTNRIHSTHDNKILEMKSYVYDEFSRLIKESIYNRNNEYLESWSYVYDVDGNILEKTLADYTGHIVRYNYIYTVNVKNRLEKIIKHETGLLDEEQILTYSSNNQFFPSSIDGKGVTYKGRKITSYGDVSYIYNDQGIRTDKITSQSQTSYILEGSQVIQSKYVDTSRENPVIINYHYDETGNLFGLRYSDIEYYYQRDIFGNIISIVDETKKPYVVYNYNGYGEPKIEVNMSGMTMGELAIAQTLKDHNIYIYKGYIYDQETQMYYLQSRYYHPSITRFITPDDPSYLSVEHINGLNLYAYCSNNPMMYIDRDGTSPEWWQIALIAGIAVVAVGVIILTAGSASAGIAPLLFAYYGISASTTYALTMTAATLVSAGILAFAAADIQDLMTNGNGNYLSFLGHYYEGARTTLYAASMLFPYASQYAQPGWGKQTSGTRNAPQYGPKYGSYTKTTPKGNDVTIYNGRGQSIYRFDSSHSHGGHQPHVHVIDWWKHGGQWRWNGPTGRVFPTIYYIY